MGSTIFSIFLKVGIILKKRDRWRYSLQALDVGICKQIVRAHVRLATVENSSCSSVQKPFNTGIVVCKPE